MTTILLPRRRIPLKPLPIISLAIIGLAIALAYNGLNQSFRPYTTTIGEAIDSGRGVQLAGYLGGAGTYDTDGNFTFPLQDSTGAKVKVVYTGTRPSNFEHAVHIVAIGRYNAAQQVFLADELLVKCPSKYQEMQDAGSE